METKVYISESHNPYFNLAFEEYLFNKSTQDEILFFLWQNNNTIVIGKNQNPFFECDMANFEIHGGQLARRLSGGGTVYHDLGNLNFSFILPRDKFDLKKQFTPILNPLQTIGINAYANQRNDLLVDNKKFSGNAFYHSQKKSLHHGTLLINTDINKIIKYLRFSKEVLSIKGIKSIQSNVVNLSSLKSSINKTLMINLLINSFSEVYKTPVGIININEDFQTDLNELYMKYSSEEWIYGKTPYFTYEFEKFTAIGKIFFKIKVRSGKIIQCIISSDSLEQKKGELLSNKLLNTYFHFSIINQKIDDFLRTIIEL